MAKTIEPQQQRRRTCPCKRLPLALSSFTAAEYGDLHSLQKSGRSIAQKVDEFGTTPLHLAAQNDHLAAVAALLQLGCHVDGSSGSANNSGATPLHRAAFSGAVGSMRILIQHGADLLATDVSFDDQMTPLHKAAAGGRYLAVQLLLEALRTTRLATNNDEEQQRQQSLLAEALEMKDSRGRTPLEVAQELHKIQKTERDSVARWDQVAGGVADWGTCIQLLEAAAKGCRTISQQGDSRSATNSNNKEDSKIFSIPLPPSLSSYSSSRKDGYFDCCEEGEECVTASWQAQFQSALGKSINVTSDERRESPTVHGKEHMTKNRVANPKRVEVREESASSGGVGCSMCGKKTIALYPTTTEGCLL
eukprot:scaffold26170_cov132-Cylindrotheca_fusiformis.AAC.1